LRNLVLLKISQPLASDEEHLTSPGAALAPPPTCHQSRRAARNWTAVRTSFLSGPSSTRWPRAALRSPGALQLFFRRILHQYPPPLSKLNQQSSRNWNKQSTRRWRKIFARTAASLPRVTSGLAPALRRDRARQESADANKQILTAAPSRPWKLFLATGFLILLVVF